MHNTVTCHHHGFQEKIFTHNKTSDLWAFLLLILHAYLNHIFTTLLRLLNMSHDMIMRALSIINTYCRLVRSRTLKWAGVEHLFERIAQLHQTNRQVYITVVRGSNSAWLTKRIIIMIYTVQTSLLRAVEYKRSKLPDKHIQYTCTCTYMYILCNLQLHTCM